MQCDASARMFSSGRRGAGVLPDVGGYIVPSSQLLLVPGQGMPDCCVRRGQNFERPVVLERWYSTTLVQHR